MKLCQVLLQRHPELRKLIILSRNKDQQETTEELLQRHPKLKFYLGDIQHRRKLIRITEGVDYIIQAIEYEQVPVNSTDLIKTYINGTQNLIEAALERNVDKVLFLSTDKACNPVGLLGVVKLCAEKLILSSNLTSHTQGKRTAFSVLRYGRAITGTDGVISQLRRLRETGCLSIADPNESRYWFTLEHGVAWVLKSLSEMRGGEIIIPQTPALRILDLAKVICQQCQLKTVGLRSEEKLHDLLITADEAFRTLEYSNHFVIQPEFPWWDREEYKESTGGREVAEDFTYGSGNSGFPLSFEELRILLREK